MQEGKLQEVKDGLFVDMYDALLFDGKNEIRVDGVDSAVTYFSQISKPKKKDDFEESDFNRLKEVLELEFGFIAEECDNICHDFFSSVYQDRITSIKNKLEKLNRTLEELNRTSEELNRTSEEQQWQSKSKKVRKKIEKNREKIKKIEEIKKELTKKMSELPEEDSDVIYKKQYFIDRKREFFKPIEGFDDIKSNYEGLCQVGNVLFVEGGDNIKELYKIYKDCIEKNKENKKQVIFYVISGKEHWYLYVQQGENIFKLNVSQLGDNDNLMLNEKDFNVYSYDNKKYKMQYSSGCCEMYCVLLSTLITRSLLFNCHNSLRDILIFDERKKTFQLPFVFFYGLNEKAFSDRLSGDFKSNYKLARVKLLEENIEHIKDVNCTDLYFNPEMTFKNLFLQYLTQEKEYINNEIIPLNEKNNIKGSFIYRYALFISSIVDNNYKKYLKEYIIKNLYEKGKKDEIIDYFKDNFDSLFLEFSKKFLGYITVLKEIYQQPNLFIKPFKSLKNVPNDVDTLKELYSKSYTLVKNQLPNATPNVVNGIILTLNSHDIPPLYRNYILLGGLKGLQQNPELLKNIVQYLQTNDSLKQDIVNGISKLKKDSSFAASELGKIMIEILQKEEQRAIK